MKCKHNTNNKANLCNNISQENYCMSIITPFVKHEINSFENICLDESSLCSTHYSYSIVYYTTGEVEHYYDENLYSNSKNEANKMRRKHVGYNHNVDLETNEGWFYFMNCGENFNMQRNEYRNIIQQFLNKCSFKENYEKIVIDI